MRKKELCLCVCVRSSHHRRNLRQILNFCAIQAAHIHRKFKLKGWLYWKNRNVILQVGISLKNVHNKYNLLGPSNYFKNPVSFQSISTYRYRWYTESSTFNFILRLARFTRLRGQPGTSPPGPLKGYLSALIGGHVIKFLSYSFCFF